MGLKVYKKKNKYLTACNDAMKPIKVEDQDIKEVDEIVNLENVVSTAGGIEGDMKCRLGKLYAAFKSLKKIWSITNLFEKR